MFLRYFSREGETVILKCLIQAHPWVYRILWYRDGEEIVASDRTFIDEQQVLFPSVFCLYVDYRITSMKYKTEVDSYYSINKCCNAILC
jgi:hypothetical protein